MKLFHSVVIALVLAATIPSFAMADGEACRHLGDKHFTDADTDKDSTVDKAEYRAISDKQFDQMDTDHDGTLTKEELMMGTRHMKMKQKEK